MTVAEHEGAWHVELFLKHVRLAALVLLRPDTWYAPRFGTYTWSYGIPKVPTTGNPDPTVNFEIELRHRTDGFYNRGSLSLSKCCGWDIRTDQRVGQ